MIAVLITAPGEQYRLAHRPTEAASDRTRCGQPVTPDWQGLPAELMTPICPACDRAVPTEPAPRTPARPSEPHPQSSGHPTTTSPVPTPHAPTEPLARTAERTPRGSHHNAMWRILAALTGGTR